MPTSEVVNSTGGKLICRCPDALKTNYQHFHSSTHSWQRGLLLGWQQQKMSPGGPAQIPVHSTGTGVLGTTHCHIPTSYGHSVPVIFCSKRQAQSHARYYKCRFIVRIRGGYLFPGHQVVQYSHLCHTLVSAAARWGHVHLCVTFLLRNAGLCRTPVGTWLNCVSKGLSTAIWSRDAKDMRYTSTQLSIAPAQPQPLAWILRPQPSSLLSHHHHDPVHGDLEGSLKLGSDQQYLQCKQVL